MKQSNTRLGGKIELPIRKLKLARFGRGFSERNLEQMRLFYMSWPISQTLSAKSALEDLPNKVMVAEYKTALPNEQKIAAELDRTRALLERNK